MADARTARSRLDAPQPRSRAPWSRGAPAYDPDRWASFAENFARFMGTATFLAYMTLFVLVWVGWNAVVPADLRWDDYPFIFLTLMLSLQASYAAPLILLAQNRQEDRDRVIAEQDRQANTRAHADMEFLAREVASLRMAVGRGRNPRLRALGAARPAQRDRRTCAVSPRARRAPRTGPLGPPPRLEHHEHAPPRPGERSAGHGQRPGDQATDHRPRNGGLGRDR